MSDDDEIIFSDVGVEGFNHACREAAKFFVEKSLEPREPGCLDDICGNIDNLLAEGKRQGLLMMKSFTQGCMPTLVLFNKYSSGIVMPIIMSEIPKDYEVRLKMRSIFSLLVNMHDITAYLYISEAWVASYPLDGKIDRMPSEREDRSEVLIVTAYLPGQTKTKIYEIIRGETKEDITINPEEFGISENDSPMEIHIKNPLLQNVYVDRDAIMKLRAEKSKTFH